MNFKSLSDISVTKLTGVGPALAQKLAKINIFSVQDVLLHLPFRYQDRTKTVPIAMLQAEDYAVVEGEIIDMRIIQKRRRFLQLTLSDHTSTLQIIFFHFNASLQKKFSQGGVFRFFGNVKAYGYELSLIHPEIINTKLLSDKHMEQSLTPIYSSTEGLSQKIWWQLTEQALAILKKNQIQLSELIPEQWSKEFQLPPLITALQIMHRPTRDIDTHALLVGKHPAQQRLICEELLAHHISLKQHRLQARKLQSPIIFHNKNLTDSLLCQLPYSLTAAQQRVLKEIQNDLQQASPMQRLVQGDVGSGKTIVAALAALSALAEGWKVAYMAPTELLTDQHIQNFRTWFTPLQIEVLSITSKMTVNEKQHVLAKLMESKPIMIIGTHALFQEAINFERLGLIIIDEQHRFGVHQRLALRNKGMHSINGQDIYPHQLIMTATPIPRTLAMTAYADLDYSVIDELPPGRRAIQTKVINNSQRNTLIDHIMHLLAEGAQIYWVCPLIEESEVLQCQAAEVFYKNLCKRLPSAHIGLIHGRMKAPQKDDVMRAFKNNQLKVLVATTVIEVGVDVPNATYMIIENAERLGLAQLHQLRGRVGRGNKESMCILLYQAPLSMQAKFRLNAMRETQDGFIIAQKDLQLRGPGEILGTKQTGIMEFFVADLQRDQIWLDRIQKLPENWFSDYAKECQSLSSRWLREKVVLGSV